MVLTMSTHDTPHDPTPTRFVRKQALLKRFQFSSNTLYRLLRAGKFPRATRLSTNIVAWTEAEVEQWAADRAPSMALAMECAVLMESVSPR